MSRSSKRVPFLLSARHSEYLVELIEEDLELHKKEKTLTPEEEEMAEALLRRLKDVEPEIRSWYEREQRLFGK